MTPLPRNMQSPFGGGLGSFFGSGGFQRSSLYNRLNLGQPQVAGRGVFDSMRSAGSLLSQGVAPMQSPAPAPIPPDLPPPPPPVAPTPTQVAAPAPSQGLFSSPMQGGNTMFDSGAPIENRVGNLEQAVQAQAVRAAQARQRQQSQLRGMMPGYGSGVMPSSNSMAEQQIVRFR